jgi:hypothetical protein
MIMKIIATIKILLFIIFNLQGQCLEQQNRFTSQYGGPGAINESLGQSFRVCETGKLTSFAFYIHYIEGNPKMKIELYRSTLANANLVWTIDSFDVRLNWNVVDFTQGSGEDYVLNEGEIISIKFTRLDEYFSIRGRSVGLGFNYPYGHFLFTDYASEDILRDIAFRAAYNGHNLFEVVKVGDLTYPTLKYGIDIANSNDTILVIGDFTEIINAEIPANITLLIPSDKNILLTGTLSSQGEIINNGNLDATGLSFTNNGIYKGTGTFIGNFKNFGVVKPGG